MSIATITSRGFGSFGTIADVVRAGFNGGDSSIISDQDAAKIAQYVWKEVIDYSFTAKQCMRIQDSAMAGLVSGLVNGDSNPIFKSLDGLKDRMTVESDGNGNRTSITFDLT